MCVCLQRRGFPGRAPNMAHLMLINAHIVILILKPTCPLLPQVPGTPTPALGGLEPHTISAHSLLRLLPLWGSLHSSRLCGPTQTGPVPPAPAPCLHTNLSPSIVPTLISSPLTLAAPPPPQLLNPSALPNPWDLKVQAVIQ